MRNNTAKPIRFSTWPLDNARSLPFYKGNQIELDTMWKYLRIFFYLKAFEFIYRNLLISKLVKDGAPLEQPNNVSHYASIGQFFARVLTFYHYLVPFVCWHCPICSEIFVFFLLFSSTNNINSKTWLSITKKPFLIHSFFMPSGPPALIYFLFESSLVNVISIFCNLGVESSNRKKILLNWTSDPAEKGHDCIYNVK